MPLHTTFHIDNALSYNAPSCCDQIQVRNKNTFKPKPYVCCCRSDSGSSPTKGSSDSARKRERSGGVINTSGLFKSKKARIEMATDEFVVSRNSDSDDDDVMIVDASDIDKRRKAGAGKDVKPDKAQLDRERNKGKSTNGVPVKNPSSASQVKGHAIVSPRRRQNIPPQNPPPVQQNAPVRQNIPQNGQMVGFGRRGRPPMLTRPPQPMRQPGMPQMPVARGPMPRQRMPQPRQRMPLGPIPRLEQQTFNPAGFNVTSPTAPVPTAAQQKAMKKLEQELTDTKEKLATLRKNVSLLLQVILPELEISDNTVIDDIVAEMIKVNEEKEEKGEERTIASIGEEMKIKEEKVDDDEAAKKSDDASKPSSETSASRKASTSSDNPPSAAASRKASTASENPPSNAPSNASRRPSATSENPASNAPSRKASTSSEHPPSPVGSPRPPSLPDVDDDDMDFEVEENEPNEELSASVSKAIQELDCLNKMADGKMTPEDLDKDKDSETASKVSSRHSSLRSQGKEEEEISSKASTSSENQPLSTESPKPSDKQERDAASDGEGSEGALKICSRHSSVTSEKEVKDKDAEKGEGSKTASRISSRHSTLGSEKMTEEPIDDELEKELLSDKVCGDKSPDSENMSESGGDRTMEGTKSAKTMEKTKSQEAMEETTEVTKSPDTKANEDDDIEEMTGIKSHEADETRKSPESAEKDVEMSPRAEDLMKSPEKFPEDEEVDALLGSPDDRATSPRDNLTENFPQSPKSIEASRSSQSPVQSAEIPVSPNLMEAVSPISEPLILAKTSKPATPSPMEDEEVPEASPKVLSPSPIGERAGERASERASKAATPIREDDCAVASPKASSSTLAAEDEPATRSPKAQTDYEENMSPAPAPIADGDVEMESQGFQAETQEFIGETQAFSPKEETQAFSPGLEETEETKEETQAFSPISKEATKLPETVEATKSPATMEDPKSPGIEPSEDYAEEISTEAISPNKGETEPKSPIHDKEFSKDDDPNYDLVSPTSRNQGSLHYDVVSPSSPNADVDEEAVEPTGKDAKSPAPFNTVLTSPEAAKTPETTLDTPANIPKIDETEQSINPNIKETAVKEDTESCSNMGGSLQRSERDSVESDVLCEFAQQMERDVEEPMDAEEDDMMLSKELKADILTKVGDDVSSQVSHDDNLSQASDLSRVSKDDNLSKVLEEGDNLSQVLEEEISVKEWHDPACGSPFAVITKSEIKAVRKENQKIESETKTETETENAMDTLDSAESTKDNADDVAQEESVKDIDCTDDPELDLLVDIEDYTQEQSQGPNLLASEKFMLREEQNEDQ